MPVGPEAQLSYIRLSKAQMVFQCSDRRSMCHFIVDRLRAAGIGVGVAIVVAGDGVARALGKATYI